MTKILQQKIQNIGQNTRNNSGNNRKPCTVQSTYLLLSLEGFRCQIAILFDFCQTVFLKSTCIGRIVQVLGKEIVLVLKEFVVILLELRVCLIRFLIIFKWDQQNTKVMNQLNSLGISEVIYLVEVVIQFLGKEVVFWQLIMILMDFQLFLIDCRII
eukprot:TRINITY_DN10396_c0_g1_i1.p1 TRINITY_DN10396_c0_g1~~TRINITY_DN10396_c0_g1_i1.p1  ORF type:complete len:182 (-),score=5.12 TRINITY_DN10396_c0_g1_i1:93-563(-)